MANLITMNASAMATTTSFFRRRRVSLSFCRHQFWRQQSSSSHSTADSDSGLFVSSSSSSKSIPDDVYQLIKKYTKKRQTSASLQTLMKTGRGELLSKSYKDETMLGTLQSHQASEAILIQVASFLHKEIPIRLAHRIQDLHNVPMMKDMPSVQQVKNIYINSFLQLIEHNKIKTVEDEVDYANTLDKLYANHSNVLMQMAKGAYELRAAVHDKQLQGDNHERQQKVENGANMHFAEQSLCHEFLDRFYTSRIGIRVLAGQYLALRHEPIDGYIGMICSKTSPYEIVQHAASDATMICERKYGLAPEVIVTGRLDLTFPYIPTHLHYILLELIKNAMRATIDKHDSDGLGIDYDYPAITVIIADGHSNEDVVIKVADVGGGIKRSNMKKIWSYLFTTAGPDVQNKLIGVDCDHVQDHSTDTPLAGLGFGLPISRSYARYFGGDLAIMSMEGYGTDAFIHLKRLGDTREPLPV